MTASQDSERCTAEKCPGELKLRRLSEEVSRLKRESQVRDAARELFAAAEPEGVRVKAWMTAEASQEVEFAFDQIENLLVSLHRDHGISGRAIAVALGGAAFRRPEALSRVLLGGFIMHTEPSNE